MRALFIRVTVVVAGAPTTTRVRGQVTNMLRVVVGESDGSSVMLSASPCSYYNVLTIDIRTETDCAFEYDGSYVTES